MKTIIKILSAALAVLMLIPFAVSCGNTSEPGPATDPDVTTEEPSDTTPADTTLAETTPDTTVVTTEPEPEREPTTLDLKTEQFRFTLASNLGSSVSTFTNPLLTSLQGAGLKFTLASDTQSAAADVPEIVIGKANRAESKSVYGELRADDYVIALVGKKLVITGGNDDAVGKAVYYYLTNYVMKQSFSYTEGVLYSFKGTYTSDAGLLCGKKPGAYTIIYGAADKSQNVAAKILKETLENETGYVLDLLPDTAAAGECEIVVGKNSHNKDAAAVGDKTYTLGSSGTKVYLNGDTFGTLVDAVKKLASLLVTSAEVKDLNISEKSTSAYFDTLKGKTLYVIGDSYFAGEGLDPKSEVWPAMLTMKYGLTFENYGKGGSTVSDYITTNTPMVSRISSMKAGNPDIIFFEGGANDWNHQVPLGTKDDTVTTTFCGALKSCIEQLHAKYPNAFIVCISCWDYGTKNGIGLYSTAYAAATVEIAGMYDYTASINASTSECPVRMNDDAFRAKYSIKPTDKSHLNVFGQSLVFPFFEAKVGEAYDKFMRK